MPFLNVKRSSAVRILTLGDSRSDTGIAVTLWPNKLTLSAGMTVANFGKSGWTQADVAADISTSIAPYITAHSGSTFYAVIGPLGANDLSNYVAATDAIAASNYAQDIADHIIEPLLALGVTKVALFTEMQINNSTHAARRGPLNTIYRTGVVGGNPVTVIDSAADPTMSETNVVYTNPALYGNAEWWRDSTHQGAKGDLIYAGLADAAIAAMRSGLPADITLPVTAQTDGVKAANFFPGWQSPQVEVFSFGGPSGTRKVSESNFDGRIAVKSVDQWRDGKITTYSVSLQILARLTASGRAFVCTYSGVVAGGLLAIDEVSGVNPALPILNQNAPSNGTVVRPIYSSAAGGGTMVSRFGPSGTDVVANYSTTYTAGDTLTFILDAFRIAVMWKNTVIVDLPYDGWTLMEAGRWALAPTVGFGVLDSTMDFTPLTVLPSVADGIAHPSDFGNPAAPVINAYDMKMRGLRQLCSVAAGSATISVSNAAAFTPYIGEQFIVEAGTVEMVTAKNPSNVGNGFLKMPYIPPVGSPEVPGVEGDESRWLEGVYTVVVQPGATTWRLTAPNAEVLGTAPIDNRINGKIYAHLMQGSVPFIAGDSFTITVTCKGETTTDTYDGLKAAGRQRTIGVGGQWPPYAITRAQRLANANPNGQADRTLAYQTDGPERGKAYYWQSGAAAWVPWNDGYIMGNQSQPKALKAKLVSVNTGANTITLATAATAATTGVYIYHDAQYALDRILNNLFAPYPNVTVWLPAGHFGLGAAINIAGRKNAGAGWAVRGEGQGMTILEVPRGVDGTANGSFFVSQCDNFYARDFDLVMQGNQMAGFTMAQDNGPASEPTQAYGAQMQGCGLSWFDRISVYNCNSNAFEMSQCTDCQLGGVINPVTDPALWMTQRSMIEAHNDYPSCRYQGWRLAVTAPHGTVDKVSGYRLRQAYVYAGVEAFLATGITFEYFDIVNGVINSNGSSGSNYRHINTVIEKNSWPNSSFSIDQSAMLQHNANQPGSTSGTLTVTNVNFIQKGPFAETGDTMLTIAVSSGTLTMRGTYDPTVADDGSRRGLLYRTHPWTPGTNAICDAAIVVSDGAGLDIEGYRIVGYPAGGWAYSINSQTAVAGVIRIVNNVADSLPPASAVITPKTGNVTNAVYNALLP